MSSVSEYKVAKTYVPKKCHLCGKILIGKCVRRLKGWQYQYFCCPRCAKEFYQNVKEESIINTETDELRAYLDKK
ncbi:MAG: hypothetical protein NC218_03425 [Acetobacter sp.]|nr:hypothetical protein [Acetobacter sp.]